jgi:hypothetical protein
MKKTEVYSWRVAFDLKQALEEAAKAEKVSDTGAILALLDADDHWHERCVEDFSLLKLPVVLMT